MERQIINPFKPGSGLFPPYLAGKKEELIDFERSLNTALSLPQNLVISGLRGTGKTVFLMKLEQICREKRWLSVRREFNFRLCDENQFLFAVLTDLVSKIGGASVKKKKIGFSLSQKEEYINANFVNTLLSKYIGPVQDRLEAVLKDLYEEIIEAGFNGLVLLYDEFHSIKDEKIANNFPLSMLLEAFSHVQQNGLRYYLVLSGLPSLFGNLVEAKTYAERMFQVRAFGNLEEKESKEAIEKPLEQTPFDFNEALVERLVTATGGYPYFLQFYSFYLIDHIPVKDVIDKEDFEQIYPFLLKRLDESFFMGRFARTSNGERELLSRVLDMGEEIKVAEIRKRMQKSRGATNLLLNNLIEKGILYRVRRGNYSFTLPLFRDFLRRNL